MRLASIALISALAAVAACGGGSDDPVDAAPRIDTRLPPDSSNPTACTFSATYETLSLGGDGETPVGDPPAPRPPVEMMPDAGVGQTPTTLNYYLAIFGNLSALEPELPNHGFQLLMTDNIGMFESGVGALGSWSGPPQVDLAAPLDQILGQGDPNQGFAGGFIEADGGMAGTGVPSQTNPPTQIFLADSGTVTLTRFNNPPVDTQQSLVFGSYDNVMMTGYDATTGNPLDPPCTITVTKLNFFYNVTWGTATAAPTPKKAVKAVDFTR